MRFTPAAFGMLALLGCGTLLAGSQLTTAAAESSPACSVAYQVSQWASGFDLSITITNGASPITAWTLEYAYSGNQQLTDGWDGNWSQSGGTVTVTNASWNGTLATGAGTTIGAVFSYSGANAPPTAFTLNGVACNGAGGTGTTGTQPAVSITSPAPGTEVSSGSTVTVTASASPGSSATVSSVTFYAADYCTGSTTDLGSATASPYDVHWADVPAGNFGVSAVVTTSQNVSVMSAAVQLTTTSQGEPSSCPVPAGDPALAIISPQQGTTVNSNLTVPISAVTSVGGDGSISSAAFYAVDTCGSTTTLDLGTVTAAPYTYQWVQPTPGIYTLTAVADDGGMSVTSSQVQIYAGPDGVPPPCPTAPPSPSLAG
jgi:hypothetical protein